MLKKKRKHKRWKNRRWWVRPINLQRDNFDDFTVLVKELKKDNDLFFRYTRMSLAVYNNLLKKISPLLMKTSLRKPLIPEQRLLITLRYLAGGESILSIALNYRVGESTVRAVIIETCSVIIDVLSSVYLKQPDEKDWLHISKGFSDIWNMPNCVGAIDGKHILIEAPPNSGSQYYNYKKTFSIVLLAACDHEYKFTLVDIGAYGSESDGGIFSRSEIGQGIKHNTLHLPPVHAFLPGTNMKTAYYFVGDNAFELSRHLMKPYPQKNLIREKKIYNYRLSRARSMIERAFGILVQRWRILSKRIRMNIDKVEKIVAACICLHNFIICMESKLSSAHTNKRYLSNQYFGDNEENMEDRAAYNHMLPLAPTVAHRATIEANRQRDDLLTWMNSPHGEVSWQYDYIFRGTYRDNH
ncbi:PREDICTED: uncharacterized protein LOC108777074 [Cyphomyrmex costatus]|uniref:uncharacterized protein LOC108777074 n=1 Tax=Cyphomyrmex costatus TaxID=456900 RepID=UPI000852247D|nr:PREDICTED: uncharacterized protein LOC108777074 [Cyphomyrmex costatus]